VKKKIVFTGYELNIVKGEDYILKTKTINANEKLLQSTTNVYNIDTYNYQDSISKMKIFV
jgi:hypothetical protein